jgi:superfamily I DNA/RNA helicase
MITRGASSICNAPTDDAWLAGQVRTEWEQIVDAWQIGSWEAYRDVSRLGRKTRLPEAQRAVLWSIFEKVLAGLNFKKLLTHAAMFTELAAMIIKTKKRPFDFIVVDEAQDLSHAQLKNLYLGADAQIIYLLGNHQIIFDGISKIDFIKQLFRESWFQGKSSIYGMTR